MGKCYQIATTSSYQYSSNLIMQLNQTGKERTFISKTNSICEFKQNEKTLHAFYAQQQKSVTGLESALKYFWGAVLKRRHLRISMLRTTTIHSEKK